MICVIDIYFWRGSGEKARSDGKRKKPGAPLLAGWARSGNFSGARPKRIFVTSLVPAVNPASL